MDTVRRWVLPLSTLVVLATLPAGAAPVVYNVSLSGASEVPPSASAGTGSGTITVDGNSLTVSFSFSGLSGTTTASHIHCCTVVAGAGTSGVATQTPTFAGFPLSVTSGSYSNTFDLQNAATYNSAFVTASGGTAASAQAVLVNGIASGQAYLNVHTTVAPGGEIRSFLVLAPASTDVPSLSSLGLALLALTLAAAGLLLVRQA